VADPTGRETYPAPGPATRALLAPLREAPSHTAVLTDFDGTLSPIVRLPDEARPAAGAAHLLSQLVARFAVVAVVSGRPVDFLANHLVSVDPDSGPRPAPLLVGQYGLERSVPGGGIEVEPAAAEWTPVVAEAVVHLRHVLPAGVLVEAKGLAVTVHWRTVPDAEEAAVAAASVEAGRSGLVAHPGRRSLELRPPLDVDKGSVVRSLVTGCSAAVYFGDDLGDLPAFAALHHLADDTPMVTRCVAVADQESDPLVLESADLVLASPGEVLGVLRWLADPAG
jgi:trehalose 6-phosphate phosphatase